MVIVPLSASQRQSGGVLRAFTREVCLESILETTPS